MQPTHSDFDPIRSMLRQLGRDIAEECKQRGAYQEPASIKVQFSANGDIRATVTTKAVLFISHRD